MSEPLAKYLVDTSIHIKRLVSSTWKKKRLDDVWDAAEPVASFYTLMEFKNAVIGALRFLIDALEEIRFAKSASDEDVVRVRLSEVIQHLNVETHIREKERRRRLANAYAARIMEENEPYPRVRGVVEMIEQLQFEAEDLEKQWFFYFPRRGIAQRMEIIDRVKCQLGCEMSPLDRGVRYGCRRDELKCEVVNHMRLGDVNSVWNAVSEGKLRLRDARLRNGLEVVARMCETSVLKSGFSIGEKLCFPVGDFVIATKAREEKLGMMTADRDQMALAQLWEMKCYFYNASDDSIAEVK